MKYLTHFSFYTKTCTHILLFCLPVSLQHLQTVPHVLLSHLSTESGTRVWSNIYFWLVFTCLHGSPLCLCLDIFAC